MNLIQIIDTFSFYGVDMFGAAMLTCILTHLLKRTLFRGVQKKVLTFLPFTIGVIIYAVAVSLYHFELTYALDNLSRVLEKGFAIGSLATLIYVLYEQFIRKDSSLTITENVIATLIRDYVPDTNIEDVAKKVAEAIANDVTGMGADKTAQIIAKFCKKDVTQQQITLLAKLIIEALAHISTSKR